MKTKVRYSRALLLGAILTNCSAAQTSNDAAHATGGADACAAADTAGPSGGRPEPQVADGVKTLLQAFDRMPVVAFGDSHGLVEEIDFLITLIRNPDFPKKVNNIVVEFGNSLPQYQALMDRYILDGEEIPNLSDTWSNTTQAFIYSFQTPLIPKLFRAIREVNRQLGSSTPRDKRVRVILGDPPIDWSQVPDDPTGSGAGHAKAMTFLDGRDESHARIIGQLIDQGQKVLFIAGSFHIMRAPASAGPNRNAVGLLDQSHPGATFVSITHHFFNSRDFSLEARLEPWPKSSMAMVRGSWLGSLPLWRITPGALAPPVGGGSGRGGPQLPDGGDGIIMDAGADFKDPVIEEVTDAYLYLGAHDQLTTLVDSPFTFFRTLSQATIDELDRRSRIITGQPFDTERPVRLIYGLPPQ